MTDYLYAKKYMMQYRIIKSRLRAAEAIIEEIREELIGIDDVTLRSAWPDGQPHGTGTSDPTANRAVAAVDSMTEEHREKLKRQLLELEVREIRTRSELWEKRMEIEDTVGRVKDPIQQDLLRMRYIEGKTFELIAVELNYSWRHTMRIHEDALCSIKKIIKKSVVS